MQLSQIEKILGGQRVLHMRIQKRQDLIALGHHGVTKDALLNLAKYLSFSMNQIAELLPITERTLQRYTRSQHFNRAVSEQILQIAEVVAKGMEVFEDKNNFLTWMKQPNVALGNKAPLSLLGSRFGTEMVLDELGRIEHGVVS
jgi:putative toxin-antitoxin system antitoxin component (TIGR02293 family)